MYSNVVTAIDKILRSYYVSTVDSQGLRQCFRSNVQSVDCSFVDKVVGCATVEERFDGGRLVPHVYRNRNRH